MCAGLFQTPNLHLAVSILFPHLYFIYNIIILDKKRRSLEETTIRALHFLKLNLRVKSSIEEEIEKQNNQPKGHDVTKETLKTISEKKSPLLGKASDMSRVSKDQRPDPMSATKARKRKIDVADEERQKHTRKAI